MKKLISKIGITLTSMMLMTPPASASLACFMDNMDDCFPIADGTCARSGKQLARVGILCIGSVHSKATDPAEATFITQSWLCLKDSKDCYEVPKGSCAEATINSNGDQLNCFGPTKNVETIHFKDVIKAISNSKRPNSKQAAEFLDKISK